LPRRLSRSGIGRPDRRAGPYRYPRCRRERGPLDKVGEVREDGG